MDLYNGYFQTLLNLDLTQGPIPYQINKKNNLERILLFTIDT